MCSHIIVEVQQVQQFCRIQFLLLEFLHVEFHVGVGDGSLHLVVESQAVPDTLVQLLLGFVGDVDVLVALDTQDLGFVVDLALHDTITKCLCHYELDVLTGNIKLGGNIGKGDT